MSALNKLLPAILLAYIADVPCTLTSDERNELSKFVARLEIGASPPRTNGSQPSLPPKEGDA